MPQEKWTMPPEKLPRRLGRGLDALFNASPAPAQAEPETALREIPVKDIRRNPFQPRKDFAPQQLKELRESLSTSGLLQPVTVRRSTSGASGREAYELVAGERRLRAATDLRSEEHTSELQSRLHLVCRLLLEKKKINT